MCKLFFGCIKHLKHAFKIMMDILIINAKALSYSIFKKWDLSPIANNFELLVFILIFPFFVFIK